MADEQQIILPEGFKVVEYLEDTGTQWIDTGYIPDSETGLYIHAKQITSVDGFPFGCGIDATGVSAPRVRLADGNTGIFYNGWKRFVTDGIGSISTGNEFIGHTNWLNCKTSEVKRLGDNRILTQELPETLSFTPTAPLFLFRCNTGSANRVWEGRIYEAKISQGKEIVRHFIPAFDTLRSEACMYELVERKAYYNMGTSQFKYKSNSDNGELDIYKLPDGFTKVKYLISDGSQYIDTNYVPTNETGYYLEGQGYGTASTDNYFFGLIEKTPSDSRIFACATPCLKWGWRIWGTFTCVVQYIRQETKFQHNFLNSRIIKATSIGSNFTYNNLPELDFTPTLNIHLFNLNNGGVSNSNSGLKGRIDTFLISEGNEIVRQFVPCLDNNGVPCMYELYTKTTHYNQGTGQFSYPRDYINAPINLPSGYRKCVYLQSDGTQWIDTEVIPNADTGVYVKTQQLSYNFHIPLGAEENDIMYYPPCFNSSNKGCYYAYGGITPQLIYYYDKGDDLIYASSMNLYNDKTINVLSEDTEWRGILSNTASNINHALWLFSWNRNTGIIDETYGKFAGRIFRAKITQGDTLIRDFVPCLDADNRPCMYDLVNKEPYYNQSGGDEFSYCVEHQLPSDFIKLKYLGSDGFLQYIKTGYIPTNNTGMYIDAHNLLAESIPVIGMQNTTGNDRVYISGVQKNSYGGGYGWEKHTNLGTFGNVRFEASLNWLNDRKSIITCPFVAQRINTLEDLTFTPNQDIYIFGINQQGSLLHWKGNIYRAKISEGNEIVRDFVPAYDQRISKPCMYDLINNVAYYNDGAGEFLYNRDFEGTYKGYTGLGCVGNRLGAIYNHEE